jgi:peptidylprolyl isomerase
MAVGEPPPAPDRMLHVSVAADLPADAWRGAEVMDEHGPAFRARVAAQKRARGAAFSVCDVEVPAHLR